MYRRRVSGRVLAVLIAMLALAGVAVPGTVGAAEHPEVLSRTSVDFIAIPNEQDPAPLLSLRVPKGRWVAWVVVRYGVFEDVISTNVTCWTTIVGPGELDRHTVHAQTGVYSVTSEVQTNVAMSVAANVTNPRGGHVSVRCRNHGTLVVSRDVRIIAMRAGKLTRVTPLGTTSWGSGAPHLIQYRYKNPAGLPIPVTDGAQTLASIDLKPGAWWIRAHLSLQSYEDPFDLDFADWRCRLVLGSATDRTDGEILDAGLEDDRHAVTMEVATRIATPDTARLQCGRTSSASDPRLRDVRITAVPAGSLSLGHGTEGGTWTETGSGRPRVIHARLGQSDPISGHFAWVPVARVPLTRGKWLMTAKYRWGYGAEAAVSPSGDYDVVELYCRLRQEDGVSPVTARTKADTDGIPLQLVGTVDAKTGTLWLECRWEADVAKVAHLERVRVTAVRVR